MFITISPKRLINVVDLCSNIEDQHEQPLYHSIKAANTASTIKGKMSAPTDKEVDDKQHIHKLGSCRKRKGTTLTEHIPNVRKDGKIGLSYIKGA